MIAISRDSWNKERRTACWQLVGERNSKRLFHQLWISRASKCVVIILFFLDARRFHAELVQLRPSFFIGVAAGDCKHCGPQIGGQRRWVCEICCETFATTRDNFRIVQISKNLDQAGAQIPSRGRLRSEE